jgi:hypothetical protein
MCTLYRTVLVSGLLCTCTLPVLAAETSAGASLQIGHPTASSAQTVRGVRRESVDHESFAAAPNEILEIVLADGSSITLASGASVSIDRFHYDRATRLGELEVSVKSGYVRVAGGVLNNTSAVHVLTPQGDARIDNGIASFDTHESSSEVALLLGKSIALTDNGQQSTIDRAHTVVHLTPTGFEPARPLTDQEEQSYVALLNPGLTSLVAPRYVADESDETQVSSERVLSALNDAKDADTKSNVQNSIPAPPPPPAQPPPSEPTPPVVTLGDVTLGLPSANNGVLGNLQWSSTSSSIAPLTSAGGDSDLSIFFWPVNSAPTTQTASRTTTTLFGGGQSGDLWSTATGVSHGAAITFPQANTNGGVSGTSCGPTCGYGFAVNYDEQNGYLGGQRIDPIGSYLLITAPGAIQPAADQTSGSEITYTFRASLGPSWTLPGNAQIQFNRPFEIAYKSDAFANDGSGSHQTYTYLLQSGFTAPTFTVTNVPAGTPNAIQIATGKNAGYYTITGAAPTDPNPCVQAGVNLSGCESTLISLAHNRWISEAMPSHSGAYFVFADGTGRSTDAASTLVTRVDPTPQITVIRNDDNNFLLFEATGSGTDDRHFLFGNGAVTRYDAAKQSTTLDTFLLSPGIAFFANVPSSGTFTDSSVGTGASSAFESALDDCAAAQGNCALSARDFFRNSTVPSALSGKMYDTGLLVLNSAGQDVSSVFHADFGLKGTGSGQVSSISGLVGNLTYTGDTHSAAVNAALVGSTYGPGTTDPTEGITALSSQIVSTSAGGGNTRLSATGGDTRVGYLVLETGDAVAGGSLGTEHPVHSSDSDVQFSSTRLATAAGTQVVADTSRVSAATVTNGYLAGLAVASADGKIARISNLDSQYLASNNFTLTVDPVANTVTATVSDWAPGSSIGGTTTNSAYIDNNRFGAADGTRAGIVSGPAVLAGWADGDAGLSTTPDADGKTLRDKLNSFKYLQWGFFFGDSSAARDATAQAHLASWVTGKLTATDAPKPSGTATYEGYMLGNVSQVANGVTSLYTAVGTFTNTWDFNVRQGDMNMAFDGANYTGKTIFRGDQLNAARTAFVGSNNAQFVGSVSSPTGGRTGVLNGSFIDGGGQTHVGVLGRFDLGSSDGSYIASGTFGGERKP